MKRTINQTAKRSLKTKKAFTLVELLVVIAIIGILFVVLISKVDFATDKAKTAGVQTDFRSYQLALKTVGMEQQGFSNDMDLLAEQLNKNLDPKLQVTVVDDKLTTDAEDPWGTQYTITYSEPENARGKIVITSAGADRTVGTDDDYNIVIEYSITSNGGSVNIEFVEGIVIEKINLPPENPSGDLNSYSWADIQTLARANLSEEEYKSKYGIELGAKKTFEDVEYLLVDLDGNDYDGFVFLYVSKQKIKMNTGMSNNYGYGAYAKDQVNNLKSTLPQSVLEVIKPVNIVYTAGQVDYGDPNTFYTTTEPVHLFLASYKELGFTSLLSDATYGEGYNEEGDRFDYFIEGTGSNAALKKRTDIAPMKYWWLRSAYLKNSNQFCQVGTDGRSDYTYANNEFFAVPFFVVG